MGGIFVKSSSNSTYFEDDRVYYFDAKISEGNYAEIGAMGPFAQRLRVVYDPKTSENRWGYMWWFDSCNSAHSYGDDGFLNTRRGVLLKSAPTSSIDKNYIEITDSNDITIRFRVVDKALFDQHAPFRDNQKRNTEDEIQTYLKSHISQRSEAALSGPSINSGNLVFPT